MIPTIQRKNKVCVSEIGTIDNISTASDARDDVKPMVCNDMCSKNKGTSDYVRDSTLRDRL